MVAHHMVHSRPQPRAARSTTGKARKPIAFVAVVVLIVSLAACRHTPSSISVDFPQGATRLLVQRSGEAALFYGALPTHQTIKPGTFDIADLYRALRPRLEENRPRASWPDPHAEAGTVRLHFDDGTTAEYLIFDARLTGALFDKARHHIVGQGP